MGKRSFITSGNRNAWIGGNGRSGTQRSTQRSPRSHSRTCESFLVDLRIYHDSCESEVVFTTKHFLPDQGARKLTEENLKVVWAEFSTLS
jgi:hypothetical protein